MKQATIRVVSSSRSTYRCAKCGKMHHRTSSSKAAAPAKAKTAKVAPMPLPNKAKARPKANTVAAIPDPYDLANRLAKAKAAKAAVPPDPYGLTQQEPREDTSSLIRTVLTSRCLSREFSKEELRRLDAATLSDLADLAVEEFTQMAIARQAGYPDVVVPPNGYRIAAAKEAARGGVS